MAMIAVPFYFACGIRGVISRVQLEEFDSGTKSDLVLMMYRPCPGS